MSPLNIGYVLNNRYRIVKRIGGGGFGDIYRAWDLNLGRACAVKENLETSQAAQQQFEQEAMILAQLSHPNLPRVTDHFVVPGQGQYLVMDYVDGEDLQDMLDRGSGPLAEAQVLAWVEQVCSALAYLHGQNPPIIHRDIKPANIKIAPDGKAYLVDFGIAKLYDPSAKTTRGARAVTPGYSPPEQYGQGRTDGRTDIYALGATLYTLLTGQEPPESVQVSSGQAVLPPVRTLNPGVTPVVETAVQGAMETRPDDRYQKVNELLAALRATRPTPPGAATLGGTRTTRPSATPASWARLSRLVGAVVAGVLVVVSALYIIAELLPESTSTPAPAVFAPVITATETPTPTSPASTETASVIDIFGSGPVDTATDPDLATQTYTPSHTPSLIPSATATPTSTATPVITRVPGEPWGKIAYVCQLFRDDQRDQICMMNADGSGWRRMTQNDAADHNYPSFSPQGDSILYTARQGGDFQIYEMDLDGRTRQLTSASGGSYAPDVSGDDQHIVYTHEVGDIQAVWVMNRDGSGAHQVYGPPQGNGWDPVWSPDGERILFASKRGDDIQLYTISPDGSNLKPLTSITGLRGRSDWSLRGELIATYVGIPWEREIALLDTSGASLGLITSGGNNLAPNFSPDDSEWIVFTSYRDRYRDDNGCEIYIMRTNGSDIRRLTDNTYCDWQPNWGP